MRPVGWILSACWCRKPRARAISDPSGYVSRADPPPRSELREAAADKSPQSRAARAVPRRHCGNIPPETFCRSMHPKPTRAECDLLRRRLGALQGCDYPSSGPADFEIILANSDAVDTTVDVARSHRGGADCCSRYRAGPQHDAGPCDAARRIIDVLAVHHGARRLAAERDAGKPQQGAHRNTGNGSRPDEMTILPHGVSPFISLAKS